MSEVKKPCEQVCDGVLAYGVLIGRFLFEEAKKIVYTLSDLETADGKEYRRIYQISKEDYNRLLVFAAPNRIPDMPVDKAVTDPCHQRFLCTEAQGGAHQECAIEDADLSMCDELITPLRYISLRQQPLLKDNAAAWHCSHWGVPEEAYKECMDIYLNHESEYGWYLCLDGCDIIGGLGVIDNDFHDREDLTPNVCAVYTDDVYRKQGIAGNLLNMVVDDCRSKGIYPLYLLTDHVGFYERYGWDFYTMVNTDDGGESRLYVHY